MKGSTFLKRSLALVLTVVMLVSCWVFTAPSASAATAGSYSGYINFKVKDSSTNDAVESDYIQIYYKPNNGTGNETSTTIDIKASYMDRFTSTGEKSIPYTVGGWPTKIKFHVDHKWYWAGPIRRYNNIDLDWTSWTVAGETAWSGSVNLETRTEPDESTQSNGLTAPYANSITDPGGGVSEASVPTEGNNSTIATAFTYGTVKDQYSVNWYQDPVFSVVDDNGNAYTDAYIDGNKKLVIKPSANRSSDYYIRIKESRGNATNTNKRVKIKTFDYKVIFKNSDGTELKTQTGIDYGKSATPPTATKDYDATNHYDFKEWTGDSYQSIKDGKQERTATASYDAVKHTYDQTSVNNNSTLKSDATCTEKAVYYNTCTCGAIAPASANKTHTYGSALGHSYPEGDDTWTSYNDPNQHKKVCARDKSHVIYENHSFTKAEVKGGALKQSANCDIPAVYYYSCAGCGQVEFNDNHTFIDPNGSPLATHNWGSPVEFSGNQTVFKRTAEDSWGYPTTDIGHSVEATYNGEDYHVASCNDFSETHKNYTVHTPSANKYYYASAEDNNIPDSVRSDLVAKLKSGYQYNFIDESNPGQHFTYCTVSTCHHLAYENHSFTETVVPATCEEAGYTRHQCACGYYYDTDTVPATGHKYDSYTDNGDGTHSATCVNTNERTGQPCGYTLTEVCSFTLEIVLKDENGNITNAVEGREATCTVDARCYKSCQFCNSVATVDETDGEGNATAFEAVGSALGHKWGDLKSAQAEDNTPGYTYYECGNCHEFCPAAINEGAYVPNPGENNKYVVEEASSVGGNTVSIPAPLFNDSASTAWFYDGINYSTRPASFRYDTSDKSQTIRFAGSVKVPEGVSWQVGTQSDNNVVIDFGFVYTQTKYICDYDSETGKYQVDETTEDLLDDEDKKIGEYSYLKYPTADPSRLVYDASKIAVKGETGYKIYKMSVMDNSGEIDHINNGFSHHQDSSTGGTADYLTFNLVIGVKVENWGKEYAARPYITYKYHGLTYTVYDGGASNTDENMKYSHRSVTDLADDIMYFDPFDEGFAKSMKYDYRLDYNGYKALVQNYKKDKAYALNRYFESRMDTAVFKALVKKRINSDPWWTLATDIEELLDNPEWYDVNWYNNDI